MENIDLKEILKLVWKKRCIIIAIVVIFGIIGMIYSFNFVTPKYESYTTLVLAQDNKISQIITSEDGSINQTDVNLNEKLVKTYSELAKSDAVLEKVISKLSLDRTTKELKKSISVTQVTDTEIIKMTVKDIEPNVAKNIANALAEEFIVKVTEIYKINNINIVDEAKVSDVPCNINHFKDILIFTFIGVVVSAVYIFVISIFDSTVKKSEDVEANMKIKVLGEIPIVNFKNSRSELFVFEDSKSPEAEAVKKLRTRLQYTFKNKELKSLVITSAMQGVGKSVVSANLAIAFAQVGYNVILIDADMRRPRQHTIFGANQCIGLSNYLAKLDENCKRIGDIGIENYVQDTIIDNLKLISAGNIPPNASELLATKRFEDLINYLKTQCDLIIFDGAPGHIVTDSIIISRITDATVIVAEQNISRQDTINKTKKEIEEVGGNLVGMVLNKISMSKTDYGYHYRYYSSSNLPKRMM